MNTNGKLEGLPGKIRRLQHGFLDEIRGPERESSFGVRGRKIHFQAGVVDEHRVVVSRGSHITGVTPNGRATLPPQRLP